MKKRTAILISGTGSNMQKIVEAAKAEDYPASIELVFSNNPYAPGLKYAEENGIPVRAASHRGMSREEHESCLFGNLKHFNIELICLAGYMRVLTPLFVGLWTGKMINIHPSLLPAFTGLHTHRRALEHRVKYHGCTVHVVTEELDWGPIIDQAIVTVDSDDTEESLAAKVLEQEHILYPKALKYFVNNMM